jgi:hypothetical protein
MVCQLTILHQPADKLQVPEVEICLVQLIFMSVLSTQSTQSIDFSRCEAQSAQHCKSFFVIQLVHSPLLPGRMVPVVKMYAATILY